MLGQVAYIPNHEEELVSDDEEEQTRFDFIPSAEKDLKRSDEVRMKKGMLSSKKRKTFEKLEELQENYQAEKKVL